MGPAQGEAGTYSWAIVYDERFRQLYLDTGPCCHDTVADRAFGGWRHRGSPYLSRASSSTGITALALRQYTDSTVGRDRNDAALEALVELSHLSPWGLGQWGKFRGAKVNCSTDGIGGTYVGGGITAQVSFDGYETTEESVPIAAPTSTIGMFQFDVVTNRQKCTAFTMKVLDNTPAKSKVLHSFSFEYEPLQVRGHRSRSGSARA